MRKTSFQYRYGAKEEIKDILQSAKAPRPERFRRVREIDFEPVSVYYLCSELLEIAQVPENPHLLQSLQEKYEQFQQQNGEALLFSLEELFAEGWLQRTAEEWLWNNNSYEYERLTSQQGKKEEQLVRFLQSLKETPYKDGLYPYLREEDTELQALLKKTRVSVEGLIEKGLLKSGEAVLYVNTFSQEWEDYGERVLSQKYEEWKCAERREMAEKWIRYCELFTRCWRPEKYVVEKEPLFHYCLERLEQEESSWEQEAVLIAKAMQISANKLQEKYELSVPAYGAARQRFIQTYFERWCRLGDGHSRRLLYYGICLRNYSVLGNEYRQRFREILKKPCFEIQYFHLTNWENELCTAECVEEADLFLPAVCNLLHYIRYTNQKEEVEQFYVGRLVKPIWDTCYNGLHQANKDKWAVNLAELAVHLFHEGEFYKSSIHLSFFSNRATEVLTRLLRYYFEDISEAEEADERLLDYLTVKLGNAKDHTAQRYLGVLLLLGKYGEQYAESERRKQTILDGLFKGLASWIDLAKERDLLLSTISWSFFSEKVWNRVLVQGQGKLKAFFGMLRMSELEQAKQYRPEKSAIFSVGRLALLGLYFKALCLTELRDNLSGQVKAFVEGEFISEFLSCQNKWRLFSGENIRFGDSAVVLSKCMQALSFLSEENKKAFVEQIEVETAIDVAFWLEYVRDGYVKRRLLQILTMAQKEKLFEEIYLFTTWQRAVDNLLELCFAESEGEEDSSKEAEKMLEFVEYSLKDFEEAIAHKPESVRKDYREWQESAYCRVMLLKNQREELLSSQHEFYKGIIRLNSERLEDIQEAKRIFGQNREESVSWRSNYLIACVLEIVKKKELGGNYDIELRCYEKELSSHIAGIQGIYEKELRVAYLYGLFLYLSLDRTEKFWALYEKMPEELYRDKKIANYVIEVYLSSGKVTEARKQLEQLRVIYGETAEIKKLQERIEKTDGFVRQIEKPQIRGNTESSKLGSGEMRQLLFELTQKSNASLAEIMVDEEEFGRLNDKEMPDKHEIQVLSMVCQALKALQSYSVNLLHNQKVSSEDAYNRTLKLLFNLREERFLGFRMEEQTQGGRTKTTYRSGEQGVGRRDLLLVRKQNAVALLEGIKLWRVEKKKVEEHIGKLREYNVERTPIVIMPIYGHMPEERSLWKRYVNLLHEFQRKRTFDIVGVEEADAFLKTEFAAGLQYIVKTRHEYQEFDVVVYHVMINITGK